MKHNFVTMLASALAAFALFGCQYQSTTGSGEYTDDAMPEGLSITPAVTDADIGTAQTWGTVDNVVRVKHLYFSGQPDAEALRVGRDSGVGVVISLRDPTETQWDEAAEVKKLGMTYHNVPVSATGSGFNQKSMQAIGELVRRYDDQQILLHCSSGNRAGAWFAVHLANDHGMDIESSIALARMTGLTKQEMETRVRSYLDTSDMEKL